MDAVEVKQCRSCKQPLPEVKITPSTVKKKYCSAECQERHTEKKRRKKEKKLLAQQQQSQMDINIAGPGEQIPLGQPQIGDQFQVPLGSIQLDDQIQIPIMQSQQAAVANPEDQISIPIALDQRERLPLEMASQLLPIELTGDKLPVEQQEDQITLTHQENAVPVTNEPEKPISIAVQDEELINLDQNDQIQIEDEVEEEEPIMMDNDQSIPIVQDNDDQIAIDEEGDADADPDADADIDDDHIPMNDEEGEDQILRTPSAQDEQRQDGQSEDQIQLIDDQEDIQINLDDNRNDDQDYKSDDDIQMEDVDADEDISPIQLGHQQDPDDDDLAQSENRSQDKLELQPVKENSVHSKQQSLQLPLETKVDQASNAGQDDVLTINPAPQPVENAPENIQIDMQSQPLQQMLGQTLTQFEGKDIKQMYQQLAMMNMDQSLGAMYNPMGGTGLVATGEQAATTEAPPPKKSKREKPSLHYSLTDFYDLRKVKYTLVFDELHKKQLERSQFIYTLDLKEDATITPIVEAAIKDGHKRLHIDLGLHIKQMQVMEIAILDPEEGQEMSDEDSKPVYKKKTSVNLPDESQFYGTMPSLGTFLAPDGCPDHLKKQQALKSWYLTPRMQANFFSRSFEAQKQMLGVNEISKDLNTIDYFQKEFQYYSEETLKRADKGEQATLVAEGGTKAQVSMKKPELHLSKFLSLKMKKQSASEVIQQQMRKVLKILVSIGQHLKQDTGQLSGSPEPIQDFGIRAINYKTSQPTAKATDQTNGSQNDGSQMSTYMLTSDRFEASQLWLPQIFGTSRHPVGWSMNYLVPSGTQVVSSGEFMEKRDIHDKRTGRERTLHTYKIKITQIKKQLNPEGDALKQKSLKTSQYLGGVIPDKIGFVIGDIPYLSLITDAAPNSSQNPIGATFFTSAKKQLLYESNNYLNDLISSALDAMEKMVRKKHPSRTPLDEQGQQKNRHNLKILFLPNLFLSKQAKQSIDYTDNIHIMDEQILLARNIIEKRHRIHKILATSLAFDYFGSQVWEESQEDAWLLVSMRERIGDRFKRAKCGHNLYRYHLHKTIDEFVGAVQAGAERYALTTRDVSHFSELEIGEDIYHQKCQLIMHIIETMLGESNFCDVVRDIFAKASPTVNLPLFKRILRHCNWFQDLQKNWVDFTSCPQIYCSRVFSKKNHNLTVTLQQHSVNKMGISLNQKLKENQNQVNQQPEYPTQKSIISHGAGLQVTEYSQVKVSKSSKHSHNEIEDKLCPNGELLLSALEANQFNQFNSAKGQQAEGVSNAQQPPSPETQQKFYVETQRNCKRWINNDIKLVIYMTDGGDIYRQEEKIKLKYPKTRIQRGIPIDKRLRKGIDRKKKDVNQAIIESIKAQKVSDRDRQGHGGRKDGQQQGNDGDIIKPTDNLDVLGSRLMSKGADGTKQLAEQLYQIQSDNNQWRLGMTEDEFEEYPDWISNKLFQVNQIECPVLWVRVDPDAETIRRVKVIQSQKSWLYQLLQDRDFLGQIEACKELSNYHDKFVYNILQQVAMNEKYFYKVRKYALRALQEINVRAFESYLSHEKMFLILNYNQRNFNEKIGYYRSNDFSNVLEYYVNMYMLRCIAKSKEKEMPLKEDVQQLLAQSKKCLLKSGNEKGASKDISIESKTGGNKKDIIGDGSGCPVFFSVDHLLKKHMSFQFDETGNLSAGAKQNDQINKEEIFDPRDFSITSDMICRLMIRLIRENDNSENPFDDSFYISKLLANLGKLDNFDFMPQIAQLIEKKFKLDNIGQPSPQHCISKGAIKCYYNLRKQIFRYKCFKLPYMDPQKCPQDLIQFENKIKEAEKILDSLGQKFNIMQIDKTQPIELRAFIFQKDLKNRFIYNKEFIDERYTPKESELLQNAGPDQIYGFNRHDSLKKKDGLKNKGAAEVPQNKETAVPEKFMRPLYYTLKDIEATFGEQDFQYGTLQLQILAHFLEKYFLTKLNFKECLRIDDMKCKVIADKLLYLISEQPISAIDRHISYWSKRIYNRIFLGSNVPVAFSKSQDYSGLKVASAKIENDPIWEETEDEQQQKADELEIKKQALQGQKNKQAADAKNEQQPDIDMKVGQGNMAGVPMSQNQFDLNALSGLAAASQPPDQNVSIFNNAYPQVDNSFPMMYPMQPSQNTAMMDQNNLAATFAQMTGMAQPTGTTPDMAGMGLGIPMGNQNMAAQPFFNPDAMQNENAIALGPSKNSADKNVISLAGGGNNATSVGIQQDSAKPDNMLVSLGRDEPMKAANAVDDGGDHLEINLEGASDQDDREYKDGEDENDQYVNDQSYQSQVDRGTSQNYISGSAYEQDEDQNQDNMMNEQYSDNAGEENDDYQDDYNQSGIGKTEEGYTRVTWDQWHQQNQLHQEHEEDGDDQDVEIKEEVDDFDDVTFSEVWRQKCWDILYLLYFNPDAGPFLCDISRETLGENFDDYIQVIQTPITFQMVKEKCKRNLYLEPIHFIDDMNLVFDNCMKYNENGSFFHKAAKKLKRILLTQVQKRKLMDHQVQVKLSQRR